MPILRLVSVSNFAEDVAGHRRMRRKNPLEFGLYGNQALALTSCHDISGPGPLDAEGRELSEELIRLEGCDYFSSASYISVPFNEDAEAN